MTLARSELIDLTATSYYHVMNRCVRRSRLCGYDDVAQKDYSHRKAWIVDRIKYLSNLFAIKICAYAIMSNHYHIVLVVEDNVALNWSDDTVIQRWESLFKKDAQENKHRPEKIALWRGRLASISWFMRCLNERIARDANEEDDCHGRFWEGRFKSQALLDQGALLSAMVYVDLNPIRAGIAQTPESSEFTSIYERIQAISRQQKQVSQKNLQKYKKDAAEALNKFAQPSDLVPFNHIPLEDKAVIDFKLTDYLELVDYTGRIIREDKQTGKIPDHLCPILTRLNLEPSLWVSFVKTLEMQFSYAIGPEILLINFRKSKKRSLKGRRFAKKTYTYRAA